MAMEKQERIEATVGRYLHADLTWPAPLDAPHQAELLYDLYRGCLLWGAVGDALGRPVEGWSASEIRQRFGPDGPRRYLPSRGWQGGPVGTITDDTQLTMEVARSLLAAGGNLDPEDFAHRLIAWLPYGRGKGRATTAAVEALGRGEPWWQAGYTGVPSAGNGAAMRAAPVGLAWALAPSPAPLRRMAVLTAVPTHPAPVAVAGAIAIAAGVAWCVRERLRGAESLDAEGFVAFVCTAIQEVEQQPVAERKPGGLRVYLRDRIRELPGLLATRSAAEVFAHTWSGGFTLESVPAALASFLRSPDDPSRVLLTAISAGHDTDSIASMAGNLAGAWCGAERLRREQPDWWEGLEYRDEIIGLADGLARVALSERPPA